MNRAQRRAQATRRPSDEESGLPDAARRWIAERLLAGDEQRAIVQRLFELGTPPTVTKSEIERALANPYYKEAEVLRDRVAKRDWILSAQARLAAIDGDLDGVEVAERLDPDTFFRDYYAKQRPVLIAGLIDHWPAMEEWGLDYFGARLPDASVSVQTRRESSSAYEIEAPTHREQRPLAEILAALRSGIATNDFYVTAGNSEHNRAALAPLWEDVGTIPGYLSDEPGRDGFFWMGPKGTVTPFHHDLTNNLLMQIRGRKQVTMAPAAETPRMRNARHCFSGWSGPDEIAAAPEAERPRTLSCIIEPGQTLFIPVGWWHHVVGLDTTIGMSFTNFARDNDFYSDYRCYGAV